MYNLIRARLQRTTDPRGLLPCRAASNHAPSSTAGSIVAEQKLPSSGPSDLPGRPKLAYRRQIRRPEVLDAHDTTKWIRFVRKDEEVHLPLSAAAISVKDCLQDSKKMPFDTLKAALTTESVDLATIEVCLDHHFQRLQRVPKSQTSDFVQKCPIAGVIVEYLLRDNDAWLGFVMSKRESVFWLSYCAVLEGLQDILLDWVKVDVDATNARRSFGPKFFIWRGLFLRNIIRAQLLRNDQVSADDALNTLFNLLDSRTKAVRLLETSGQHTLPLDEPGTMIGLQWLTVSHWPATIEISNQLVLGSWRGTSPELYDRFIDLVQKYTWKSSQDVRDLIVAQLHLQHPTKPSAKPTISLFRRLFGTKSTEEIEHFLPGIGKAREPFRITFLKATRQARAQGLYHDALWLAEKHREIFPAYFERKAFRRAKHSNARNDAPVFRKQAVR
ncbi:hypothetical protein LTR78_010148 [Recurvomyces mirabilis]|uniref:Uncharacterized protein n=1 Tax=Recurvomyces mirabilis TaxID=574656 RepID=A0AAE0TSL9_9PEZI|nr:hypothetical protein LTR78_010148 [Recurvomyces mirabilis]KAK5149939.1 hypothetical protein LTS14_010544 [Recurvomyces mirabilis]